MCLRFDGLDSVLVATKQPQHQREVGIYLGLGPLGIAIGTGNSDSAIDSDIFSVGVTNKGFKSNILLGTYQ